MKANDFPAQACSYKDAHGGTVVLDPDQVLTYAGVKTEQLRVITWLLTEATINGLELGGSSRDVLQLMAGEYVHSVERLVELASSHEHTRKIDAPPASKKGDK